MGGKEPIVVAVDGSDESRRALAMAVEISKALGRPLHLATVVPPAPVYFGNPIPTVVNSPEVLKSYRDALDAAARSAATLGAKPERADLLEGPVVDAILKTIEERHPYLVVLGARGLSTGARLFLGSVSDGIVHHARCPVLVVRGPTSGA